MPFVRQPGVTGRIYVPSTNGVVTKKHACADCYACQHCGKERCRVCRCDEPLGAPGCDDGRGKHAKP
jgi:hypothetical protein